MPLPPRCTTSSSQANIQENIPSFQAPIHSLPLTQCMSFNGSNKISVQHTQSQLTTNTSIRNTSGCPQPPTVLCGCADHFHKLLHCNQSSNHPEVHPWMATSTNKTPSYQFFHQQTMSVLSMLPQRPTPISLALLTKPDKPPFNHSSNSSSSYTRNTVPTPSFFRYLGKALPPHFSNTILLIPTKTIQQPIPSALPSTGQDRVDTHPTR